MPAQPKSAPRSEPFRAWQRMLSGRRLDLLDPSPLDVEIEDIAHGLARVARWNGQTVGDHAYSVAQHSLLVDHIFCLQHGGASPHERLATLLHDAPEYVIGDMISPFKAVLDDAYKSVEERLQAAVQLRFGLPAIDRPASNEHISASSPSRAKIRPGGCICSAARRDEAVSNMALSAGRTSWLAAGVGDAFPPATASAQMPPCIASAESRRAMARCMSGTEP